MGLRHEYGLIRGVLNALLIEGIAVAVFCLAWHAVAGERF
jgi:hypothetical protein